MQKIKDLRLLYCQQEFELAKLKLLADAVASSNWDYIFQFENEVKVISPESDRDEFVKYINKVKEGY